MSNSCWQPLSTPASNNPRTPESALSVHVHLAQVTGQLRLIMRPAHHVVRKITRFGGDETATADCQDAMASVLNIFFDICHKTVGHC